MERCVPPFGTLREVFKEAAPSRSPLPSLGPYGKVHDAQRVLLRLLFVYYRLLSRLSSAELEKGRCKLYPSNWRLGCSPG
eukprot:1161960-Pelagomonas_calceolata.AAC.14